MDWKSPKTETGQHGEGKEETDTKKNNGKFRRAPKEQENPPRKRDGIGEETAHKQSSYTDNQGISL